MVRIPVQDVNWQQLADDDIIRSWEWLRSFVSNKDWENRKKMIEGKIAVEFKDTSPFSQPLTEGTLQVIKDDVIGWYLYLVEMLIYEQHKYEYFQGARIVPIFKRFGIDLNLLKGITGIEKKVRTLIKNRRSEADAFLFEMLTALLWTRNDYEVEFINEGTGQQKSPDLQAKLNGRIWNIECKRQSKTSDYAYRETAKRQKMISKIGQDLLKRNILLEITFHVELETLPDDYLEKLLKNKLNLAVPGKIVSNDEVEIILNYIDISSINRYLQDHLVKNASPLLNYLIGGKAVDNKAFTRGLFANFYRVGDGNVNNLFVSQIGNAYGVYWVCDAKESLHAKARDIRNQVFTAMQQFNSTNTAVIHIGMETFDGPKVEMTRFEKIQETIKNVNPVNTPLRWIFCHFFQAYSPPDQCWVFDETISSMTPYIEPKSPLTTRLMIVPEDGDVSHNLSHWERPLP